MADKILRILSAPICKQMRGCRSGQTGNAKARNVRERNLNRYASELPRNVVA